MGKYLFKVNNKDSPTNTVFSCSKSTIKNKKTMSDFDHTSQTV